MENAGEIDREERVLKAAPELLQALTAMLLVYPAGGRGEPEDREAAVYKALSAYEKATGEKWRFTGSLEKTRALLKAQLEEVPK